MSEYRIYAAAEHFELISTKKENTMSEDSPPDVVQTAYHTARGAEYARKAAASFAQATECLEVVRARVGEEGKGAPGTRHMDFGHLFSDLLQAQASMYEVTHIQHAQCKFNEEVLGNKPVTAEQLLKYGGGGR